MKGTTFTFNTVRNNRELQSSPYGFAFPQLQSHVEDLLFQPQRKSISQTGRQIETFISASDLFSRASRFLRFNKKPQSPFSIKSVCRKWAEKTAKFHTQPILIFKKTKLAQWGKTSHKKLKIQILEGVHELLNFALWGK